MGEEVMSDIRSQPAKDWILTYTGKHFNFLDPEPENIDIHDIAHALAFSARWGGHIRKWYDIAQHSVHVMKLVPPEHQLAALLHDAGEAYLVDIPRPIRKNIQGFDEIEENLVQAIFDRFKVPYPIHPSVWEADNIMLATEWRDLMNNPDKHQLGICAEPLAGTLKPIWFMAKCRAERAFLRHFKRLIA